MLLSQRPLPPLRGRRFAAVIPPQNARHRSSG